jgi:hypothetical protein
MTVATHVLDTREVDAARAAAIESAEIAAWRDLIAAAPTAWAQEQGLAAREIGGALVTSWAASGGRRYFSRAIGFGVIRPATEAALDEILAGWEREGIDRFLLQSQAHCEPAGYDDWLADRGLEPFDRQERLVRAGGVAAPGPALPASGRDLRVESVTRETTGEWAAFVDRVYDLDTGPWLPALVGRPGWTHLAVREDGELVASRSMFLPRGGAAWLCIDSPVPGLRTDDYEPDAVLCAALTGLAVAHGARFVGADIEAPSAAQDTPAYATFAALGFTAPYAHIHHGRL